AIRKRRKAGVLKVQLIVERIGWTAELKIPFSQLRYGNQAEPVWGLQVQRLIFRKQERSTWQYIPQNSGGWVSGFAELHGLRNLTTRKQVELAPYVIAQTERFEKEDGNPFADGSRNRISAGLDGKLAVTGDLILDFPWMKIRTVRRTTGLRPLISTSSSFVQT
ncbi:MAG: hypothetical protein ABIQ93_03740, partial [Saprospiraceae bacterium]